MQYTFKFGLVIATVTHFISSFQFPYEASQGPVSTIQPTAHHPPWGCSTDYTALLIVCNHLLIKYTIIGLPEHLQDNMSCEPIILHVVLLLQTEIKVAAEGVVRNLIAVE